MPSAAGGARNQKAAAATTMTMTTENRRGADCGDAARLVGGSVRREFVVFLGSGWRLPVSCAQPGRVGLSMSNGNGRSAAQPGLLLSRARSPEAA